MLYAMIAQKTNKNLLDNWEGLITQVQIALR